MEITWASLISLILTSGIFLFAFQAFLLKGVNAMLDAKTDKLKTNQDNLRKDVSRMESEIKSEQKKIKSELKEEIKSEQIKTKQMLKDTINLIQKVIEDNKEYLEYIDQTRSPGK